MKSLIVIITLLSFSSLIQAASTCDLSANDQSVNELNETFDRGEMRGEDHLIGLKVLYTERLAAIETCVGKGETQGISKAELLDTLDKMNDDLEVFVEEMNEAILNSVENDRIGIATELTLERDTHIADIKNLMEKIKRLLAKPLL